jgi:hypothetical protein
MGKTETERGNPRKKVDKGKTEQRKIINDP